MSPGPSASPGRWRSGGGREPRDGPRRRRAVRPLRPHGYARTQRRGRSWRCGDATTPAAPARRCAGGRGPGRSTAAAHDEVAGEPNPLADTAPATPPTPRVARRRPQRPRRHRGRSPRSRRLPSPSSNGTTRALSMLLRHAAGETLAEIGATEGVTGARLTDPSPSTSGETPMTGGSALRAISPPRKSTGWVAPRSAQWVNIWAQTGAPAPGVGRRMLNVYARCRSPVGTPGYPVNVTRNRPWPMLDYWWTHHGGDPGGYPTGSRSSPAGLGRTLLVAQEGGPTWEVIGVDRGPGGWWAALWGAATSGLAARLGRQLHAAHDRRPPRRCVPQVAAHPAHRPRG